MTLDALQTPAVRLMGSPAELAAGGIGAMLLAALVANLTQANRRWCSRTVLSKALLASASPQPALPRRRTRGAWRVRSARASPASGRRGVK